MSDTSSRAWPTELHSRTLQAAEQEDWSIDKTHCSVHLRSLDQLSIDVRRPVVCHDRAASVGVGHGTSESRRMHLVRLPASLGICFFSLIIFSIALQELLFALNIGAVE